MLDYPKCEVMYYAEVRTPNIKKRIVTFRAILRLHPSLKRGTVESCEVIATSNPKEETIEVVKELESTQIGKGKNILKCQVIRTL